MLSPRLTRRSRACSILLGLSSLLPMERRTFFERFVRSLLIYALGIPAHQFLAAGCELHPGLDNQIPRRPNLCWRQGQRIRFVRDVEYKGAGDCGRARQADLYQMLSYATRCRTRHALPIHAGPKAPRRHHLWTDLDCPATLHAGRSLMQTSARKCSTTARRPAGLTTFFRTPTSAPAP